MEASALYTMCLLDSIIDRRKKMCYSSVSLSGETLFLCEEVKP